MARKATSGNIRYDNAYVHGSAVRKLKTQEATVSIPLQTEEQLEEKRIQRAKQRQIRRANKMNLLYTIAVSGVVVVIFTICYQYLNLQSTVKANATEVSELREELNTLTNDNDEMEVQINASIDYDQIYDIAVNELGMIYPNKSQVITYESGESEYVKQYMDIPSSN